MNATRSASRWTSRRTTRPGITNTYDLGYNRGPVGLRRAPHVLDSSWIYEFPWAREKLYGGWQVNGILYLRGGLPLTITQTQGVQSTGTGNRPNRVCDGQLDNPTVEKWFDTSCFVPHDGHRPARTATRAATSCADRVVQHRRVAHQEHADSAASTPRFRIEAFNVLNHPQFAQPEHQRSTTRRGWPDHGRCWPARHCSLCGTTERQVQIGVKVRF